MRTLVRVSAEDATELDSLARLVMISQEAARDAVRKFEARADEILAPHLEAGVVREIDADAGVIVVEATRP